MQKHWRLACSCFFLGFCSLSYEFMLAQLMSLLEGHTVFFYGLTIGIYIFGLGIGSLGSIGEVDIPSCLRRLTHLELCLAALGGCSPLLLSALQSQGAVLGQSSWTLAPTIAIIFAIAFLSGRELPYLLRMAEIDGDQIWVTRLVGIDYLASFLGALAFPLWVFPRFGIVASALILGILNLLAVFLLMDRKSDPWLIGKTSLGIIMGLTLWSFSDTVSHRLSLLLSTGMP